MSTLAVRPACLRTRSSSRTLSACALPSCAGADGRTQKEHLMRMQFRGQMSSYTQMYPTPATTLFCLIVSLWKVVGCSHGKFVPVGGHCHASQPAKQGNRHGAHPEAATGSRKAGCPSIAASSVSILAPCAFIAALASRSSAKTRCISTSNGARASLLELSAFAVDLRPILFAFFCGKVGYKNQGLHRFRNCRRLGRLAIGIADSTPGSSPAFVSAAPSDPIKSRGQTPHTSAAAVAVHPG